MKQTLTIFILFIFTQIGFGQSELCNAVINWQYDGIVKVYDEPNGKELISLQNDLKNEDFIDLKIKELKGEFFCVEISMAMDDAKHYGWIERKEYIGVFMKNSDEFIDLKFYSKPNDKLSELIEIKHWKSGFVTIEECGAEWTKVSINSEGKRISGWIESEKLCANNYSTCS